MTKKFYTDKDIEELFQSGVKSLQAGDDVVLTDLAYEKAQRLGLLADDSPPAAPVRPYLSEVSPRNSKPKLDSVPMNSPLPMGESKSDGKRVSLEKRIREKVAARLGNQVDPQLLDSILQRTFKVLGVK